MGGDRGETASRGPHVLLAEEDERVRQTLCAQLERAGIVTETACDHAAALDAARSHRVDLLLLGRWVAGANGLDLVTEVRRCSQMPVILLARGSAEGVRALEFGADDYVTEPFTPRELTARITAVLRRAGRGASRLDFGDLLIDADARIVCVDGSEVDLTRREFDLLYTLARPPHRVFSRDELLRLVWQSSPQWQKAATVTEHVRRLRAKLGDGRGGPRIVTLRGSGYRFDPAQGP